MFCQMIKTHILICCYFLIYLQKHVSYSGPCSPTKRIYVKEGEDAILQLSPSPVTSAMWSFEEHIVATTIPGQPIQLGYYSSMYSGRLASTMNGSLNIASLSIKDEQVFRAVLFDRNWAYICVQLYDLRMNGHDRTFLNTESSDSCGPTRQLLYNLGEHATLPLPENSRAAYVTWGRNITVHTVITIPNEIGRAQNSSYSGRLFRMDDGSLKISQITAEDQRIYRAELSGGSLSQPCTQLFDLRLKSVYYSLPCGPIKTLYLDEGDDVTLQLDPSPVTSVAWNFELRIIAITKPGHPLELGGQSTGYTGRLSSLADGSLKISALSSTDDRIFRAILFDTMWTYLCAQLYDVIMNGRDRTSPNISPLESCGPTRPLRYHLRENVTLQLPGNSKVAFVIWDINNIDHIAITKPGGNLERHNNTYNGRLSSSNDGSLKISRTTASDRLVYRAEVFVQNWEYLCTQLFRLSLQSVREGSSGEYGLQNVIRLLLSACVLSITLAFFFHHMRTEVCAKQQ